MRHLCYSVCATPQCLRVYMLLYLSIYLSIYLPISIYLYLSIYICIYIAARTYEAPLLLRMCDTAVPEGLHARTCKASARPADGVYVIVYEVHRASYRYVDAYLPDPPPLPSIELHLRMCTCLRGRENGYAPERHGPRQAECVGSRRQACLLSPNKALLRGSSPACNA